jgi:hypothetical protein
MFPTRQAQDRLSTGRRADRMATAGRVRPVLSLSKGDPAYRNVVRRCNAIRNTSTHAGMFDANHQSQIANRKFL